MRVVMCILVCGKQQQQKNNKHLFTHCLAVMYQFTLCVSALANPFTPLSRMGHSYEVDKYALHFFLHS